MDLLLTGLFQGKLGQILLALVLPGELLLLPLFLLLLFLLLCSINVPLQRLNPMLQLHHVLLALLHVSFLVAHHGTVQFWVNKHGLVMGGCHAAKTFVDCSIMLECAIMHVKLAERLVMAHAHLVGSLGGHGAAMWATLTNSSQLFLSFLLRHVPH